MCPLCEPLTRNTFFNIFQVEVIIRQDLIAGLVFFLPTGGLEPVRGQVRALRELALQARCSTAAAAQASLLEGLLKEKDSFQQPRLPFLLRGRKLVRTYIETLKTVL